MLHVFAVHFMVGCTLGNKAEHSTAKVSRQLHIGRFHQIFEFNLFQKWVNTKALEYKAALKFNSMLIHVLLHAL